MRSFISVALLVLAGLTETYAQGGFPGDTRTTTASVTTTTSAPSTSPSAVDLTDTASSTSAGPSSVSSTESSAVVADGTTAAGTTATSGGPSPATVTSSVKPTDVASSTVTSSSREPSSISPSPVSPTPTGANSSNSTIHTVQASKSGLSSGAKTGLGVGIALGLLLVAGLIAVFLLRRRRQQSRGPGPYGPVTTSEKHITDSVSYSSPQLHPQSAPNTFTATPFLPPLSAQPQSRRELEEEEEEEEVPTPVAKEVPTPQYQPYRPVERSATVRSTPVSAIALEPMYRPKTAPQHESMLSEEPPSPVSPVSPVSPMASREGSLRHGAEHRN